MVAQNRRATDEGNIVPNPDPTAQTTAALELAVSNLHELLGSGLSNVHEKLQTAIGHRAALTDAFLKGIGQRFDSVEAHRLEQKADTSAAVAAALVSQREAFREQTIASEKSIAKSEAATSEAIKQLSTTFTVAIDSANRAVNDVKDRVIAMESRARGNPDRERAIGMEEQRKGAKDNTAAIIALIGVAGAVIAIAVALMSMFAH